MFLLGLIWLICIFVLHVKHTVANWEHLLICDCVIHDVTLVYHLWLNDESYVKSDSTVRVCLQVNILEHEWKVKRAWLERAGAFELSWQLDELILCSSCEHSSESFACSVIHIVRLVDNDAYECHSNSLMLHLERKLHSQRSADFISAYIINTLVRWLVQNKSCLRRLHLCCHLNTLRSHREQVTHYTNCTLRLRIDRRFCFSWL